MKLFIFLKNWILPVAMLSGVLAYFLYAKLSVFDSTRPYAASIVAVVQPVLIFMMLFLSFCRVKLSELRIVRWHVWLLLIQLVIFATLSLYIMEYPRTGWRVLIEGAMLCFICPTATSAAVVVKKLGGNPANVITYTIFVNLLTAVAVPLFVPLVHPNSDLSFGLSFLLIVKKVFPLLLGPFVAAMLVRYCLPKLHRLLTAYPDLPFYLWAVALGIAIAMTTRSIMHTDLSIGYQLGLALVSLVACGLQFYMGRKVGMVYDDAITGGQALGQKNTVLASWMGYTFFTPITAIAGGFYSVWHNLVNSWQLYKKRQQETSLKDANNGN